MSETIIHKKRKILRRYLNETQQVTIRFITPRIRATTDYNTAG